MNHSSSSRIRSAAGSSCCLPKSMSLPPSPNRDRPPLVLLDEVGGVVSEGDVLAAHLPQLGHDSLQNRGHRDRLVHPGADVADPELQGRIIPVRPDVPPDLGAVGNAARAGQGLEVMGVLGPVGDDPGHAGPGEAAEDDAAVRFQPRVAPVPEGRAGGETEDVGQEVAGDVQRVDQEVPVLDADVHMGPEDQQALRQVLHVLLHAEIPLQRRDLLLHPGRERMGARRGDLEPVARGQLDHRAPEVHQLGSHLGGRAADLGADLDDGLVQLGLDLLQEAVVRLQDLGDVGGQLSGLRIDDLILFLDPEGERRGLHPVLLSDRFSAARPRRSG